MTLTDLLVWAYVPMQELDMSQLRKFFQSLVINLQQELYVACLD